MREALRSDHEVMAKWALWTAHRYMRAGVASPRTTGPDGRSLQKPWRQRSERAVAAAGLVRAGRRQRPWPKLLGWACIALATASVFMPMTPSSLHVGASSGRRPVPARRGPALGISGLAFDEQLGSFRWQPVEGGGVSRLVLLGDDYSPIDSVDGIEGSSWRPSEEQLKAWAAAGLGHAFATSVVNDRTVKSSLVRLDVR